MKRLIGALLLTLGLVALPIGGAGAAPDDSVRGPGCGDITVHPNYTDDFTGVATVFAAVDTAKPSCATLTYTLSVYDTAGNPLGSASAPGDGSSTINLSVEPTGGPSSVCVVFTSQTTSGRVIDQAPDIADAGCVVGGLLILDGGTGGGFMR